MLELVTLMVGAAVLLGAALVMLSRRRRAEPEPRPQSLGLLETSEPLRRPDQLRPGMLGPLRDVDVRPRDLRISLIDLAARGYLQITAVTDADATTADWLVQRSAKPVGEDLLEYEQILLGAPFVDATSVSLGALNTQRNGPLSVAAKKLTAELHNRGWFAADERLGNSKWGLAGAVVLVLGLLTTAYMLIDWLATGDFRGVVGGLLIVLAGILLASLGVRRGPLTDAGIQVRDQAVEFRRQLTELRPEHVPVGASAQAGPGSGGQMMSELLPWAIAFGVGDHLAVVFDEEARRAANWGQRVDLTIDWFTIAGRGGPRDARELNRSMRDLVNLRPGNRHALHGLTRH